MLALVKKDEKYVPRETNSIHEIKPFYGKIDTSEEQLDQLQEKNVWVSVRNLFLVVS